VPAPAPKTRPGLDLPPAYTLVALRERGNAHAHACGIAAKSGAGTFVQVGRFDLLEFAVVLEPDQPLRGARRAFHAGMAAVADGIAAHCPPEKAVSFDWPDTVRFDGARLGGARLAWPEACPEEAMPDWLVFSAMLLASKKEEGGVTPGSTSLEEEGFGPDERQGVAESFARHFMLHLHTWSERGFGPVADDYLARLPREAGVRQRAIDGNGDLLLHRGEPDPERRPLLPGLLAPAWLDPRTGGPLL
jgi:hypothetical protein